MPKVSQAHLDARRQQIIDAALECFSREGFHRTTMQDIVRASGLSFGAIYRYFKTKEAIIEAVAKRRHERERELIGRAAGAKDLPAALLALSREFLGELNDPQTRKDRRLGVQMWAEALRNRRMLRIARDGVEGPLRLLTELVRSAQRRGELPKGLDPEGAARVAVALFQGFVLQQSWDPKVSVGPYQATVAQMLAALVSAAGGRA
jgi:AcrR family transcriptional regulator